MPEPSDAAVDEVVEVLRLVWVVNHALLTRSRRSDLQLAVSAAQRLVLWLVGRHPGIGPGRIAQVLRVHPSTSTRMLRQLEGLGALARTVDPGDARRFTFTLTDAGRALSAAPQDRGEALAHEVLARLPGHKVRGAREVLAALSLALVGQPPSPGRPKRRRARHLELVAER